MTGSDFTGVMAIMGKSGDERITWNSNDQLDTARAKKIFDDLIASGHLAFRIKDGSTKGEQISEFDPKAQRLLMSPALRGG
jgi:hypothetical protein